MSRPGPAAPLLFTPGPTRVAPEILAEMARPVISHRGDEARALIREVSGLCGRLLDTSHPVLLSTSSATGLMEGAVRNCVRRRALCLTAGAFGNRWRQIVEGCGRAAVPLEAEWGRAIRPEAVADALDREDVDAVTLVHNETSTGVAHPLAAIAAAVRRRPGVLLLVDVVSSLGGMPVSVASLGADVCLAGVQKAIALPPGFSFCSVSPAALARSEGAADKGFYFDFCRMWEAAARDQTLTTPSLPHLFALRRQLQRVFAEGLEARFRRHREMAERVRRWARDRMALFAEAGFESDTVTCVRAPAGRDAVEFVAAVRREGYQISAGYGDLRSRTFRVGHMGEHTPEDVDRLLAAADRALAESPETGR